MEESCIPGDDQVGSRGVPINACEIIRYRSEMLKRVPKLPPLCIKRLNIGSKRFKGLLMGETST